MSWATGKTIAPPRDYKQDASEALRSRQAGRIRQMGKTSLQRFVGMPRGEELDSLIASEVKRILTDMEKEMERILFLSKGDTV